jgi:pimeloyl-ACP methyl ester carboxylesterase
MSLVYDRRGQGPALVLLHGLGHHRHAWDPLSSAPAEFHDEITVDLPGHGESPPLPEGTVVDLAALMRSVRELFVELGLDRPRVAGNSMGGRLALELARDGDVCSATALAPAGFRAVKAELVYTRTLLRCLRWLGHVLAPFAPAITDSVLGRGFFFATTRGRPWRLSRDQALQDQRALKSCAHFNAIMDNAAIYEPTPAPKVPITIAWETRDVILPRWQARRAQHALPHARHVLLPRCGHVPMVDASARVAELLLATTRAACAEERIERPTSDSALTQSPSQTRTCVRALRSASAEGDPLPGFRSVQMDWGRN